MEDINKRLNDPAIEQTAAGFSLVKNMNTSFAFTSSEINVLRYLANKVAEIAADPSQKKKAVQWTDHNDLNDTKPLVFADPENGWNEIINTNMLTCVDPLARVWEMHLRKQIYWAKEIKDDKVIENFFDVPYNYNDTGWGVEIRKIGGDNGGSYKIIPPVKNYTEDFPKLKFPEIIINEKESAILLDLAYEVFNGILQIRRKNTWWWTLGMTYDYINLRGLEEFMVDLLLEPECVQSMMTFLRDGILKRLELLENNGLLALNTGGTYVGSGGFGWTNSLPKQKNEVDKVTTKDMWGFCESQETVGVHPDIFGELIFPYQLSIMERFGLNCYGCCEPLEARWKYIKTIPRLRRVSVSPWSDKKKMADFLSQDYIMSVKPSPSLLAISNMDEEAVRNELRTTLHDVKGCIVEIIMKDNHTLGGNPRNISRWVEIAREEIERI